MRLDHFIAKQLQVSQRTARTHIADGLVRIAGKIEKNHLALVDQFCEVGCNGVTLQAALSKVYLMLNKPAGILSATKDPIHSTVLDLIDHPEKNSLHLAGRLDRASTGLILLTNDSQWSESLSHPDSKVEKVYLVETVEPIPDSAVKSFDEGFHFAHEDITTMPAKLEILAPRKARVTICEGKYHQIKRMFHRVNENRLISLHREQIGKIRLPDDLQPGEWRQFPVDKLW